ncbi:MAG: hypothetical protein OXG13_10020 [Gemmatimonadaceae bacterium]|nr:hypothetical protein [Gemmatimonadaceae bacterium]
MRTPLLGLLLLCLASGCGYHHYAGPLEPTGEQETALTVADDGSVTYARGLLDVVLRPMSDEELNRLFAEHSRGGVKATNPYTFGDTDFLIGKKDRQRFTVFSLAVRNYEYPKVIIEPEQVQMIAGNGRHYWSLNFSQLENYYRIYALGYRGNAYERNNERSSVMLRTLAKPEPVFNGQETEGFIVFPALHPDVTEVEVVINEAMLRFDYRDEPVEMVDITYRFRRDVGRRYHDGSIELTARD